MNNQSETDVTFPASGGRIARVHYPVLVNLGGTIVPGSVIGVQQSSPPAGQFDQVVIALVFDNGDGTIGETVFSAPTYDAAAQAQSTPKAAADNLTSDQWIFLPAGW